VNRVIGIPGGAVSILDGDTGADVVPIVAANDDSLPADVMTSETEIVRVERAINVEDLMEVASDPAVETNLVASVAPQVAAETVEAKVPLLEDDSLGLDLADLLGNKSLGHLL